MNTTQAVNRQAYVDAVTLRRGRSGYTVTVYSATGTACLAVRHTSSLAAVDRIITEWDAERVDR